MKMMETLVTFLLTGSLIQGVFCGFNINLPKKVEALNGSCVFIPCTFDIDLKYKDDLTDSAKRLWFKDESTAVFNSSSPKNGPFKGEIFGTATQKNCTTRFDNVDQSHVGSYYFRLEANDAPKNASLSAFPSSSVMEGNPVTLICSSDANPAVNYTWYRDAERPLNPVQTGPNLTINNTDPTHSGRYYCTAENKHGTQNSSVLLDVQCPVLVHLTINNTDPTHSGRYYCTAGNKHGTQNSSVLLDVQYAPKNTSLSAFPSSSVMEGDPVTLICSNAPKNTSLSAFPSSSVMEGDPVTLICSSDANPAVNYTWYRDAERPLNTVQTGSNLTINNTDPTHSGRYYCTAENKHGTQNSSVLLDVQFAPKISSSCSRSSVMACVCEAHGNPCPTLEWRLSGHVLANSTETSISEETLGSTGVKSILNIHQSLTDTDVLQCFSTNKHGSGSQQFQAVPPPQGTLLPPFSVEALARALRGFLSSSTLFSDKHVLFFKIFCIVLYSHVKILNYTWYRDTERPLNPVQTGPNLTINNTDPTHSGRYYCTAENKHGTQNSSVLLDVQFAPKISSSCSRSSVMACVCEAHGNPCPTLEWRLSGHVLANSTETSISEETLGSTGVKSILNIHQSLTDTDVLQCFSTNKHGSGSQQFQAVPPPQHVRFHHPSVLLGAAVGASVMMIVCIVMLCYERRRKEKPSQSRQDDRSGLILTQTAVSLDNDSEIVYANKGMLSSAAPSAPESLHYSSIDFTNADPPSGEIRGIASLTSEYAAVRQRPAGAADAENNTSTNETEPKKPDMTAKITDTSSPASEDVIYENTSHRYRPKEVLVSADDAEKQD
ncbi:hemicentin-2-like [Sinocyclocheilus rhinocerous]|uniref:hemicentin-2-like n=1 Tax=Sinocyclocheilus rhinocerous TaxID=307959 RepID=UPI0007B8823C|nr:PREDICTED: hemicentin-2-like [Sinocyclocheilus rhinocerous]